MTYEFDGEAYTKASGLQKEWGNRLIAGLKFEGNEEILDLGCGDGVLTARLATLVPQGNVVGIDASAGMIAAAQKQAGKNLRFVRMNIDDLNFSDRFDLIYSNAALHWVKDHKRLLRNVFAALKPNGRVCWSFAGDGNCRNFYRVVREEMKKREFAAFFDGFVWPWYMPSKSEYENLFDDIGFSEVKIEEENADRYFADVGEMVRWIDNPSLVPFVACLSGREKDLFRQRVVDGMIRSSLQSDGTCFETFRRIKVYARK